MPLNRSTFPPTLDDLCRQVFANHPIRPRPGLTDDQAVDSAVKSLQLFFDDFVNQTSRHDLVKEYCKQMATLINDKFPQALEIEPAEQWKLAQELLEMGGLVFSASTTLASVEAEFYRYAGPGKPIADLANQVFIGKWH